MRYNAHKVSAMALFAVIALVIFAVESKIPPPLPLPGIKLGLANVVNLFMLFLGERWKPRDVFMVFLTRVLLAAFITGQGMSLIYSITGGVFAITAMIAVKKKLPIPAVSVAGAIAHNLGQISAAALVLGSGNVFLYLPVLAAGGIISGLLTGFAVWTLFRLRPKFISYINN